MSDSICSKIMRFGLKLIISIRAWPLYSWVSSDHSVTGPTAVTGLRKYVEWMTRGRRTDRTAYVTSEFDLPAPVPGAEWQLDPQFDAAKEVSVDPALKAILTSALDKGTELAVLLERPKTASSMSWLSDNKNSLWSPEQDAQLRAQAISGIGAGVIAKRLNRTESAVRARASRLGIVLRLAKIRAPQS